MVIVTRKALQKAAAAYPETAREIAAWVKIVSSAQWQSFVEVRETFPDADAVDGHVIFNIRRNRFRLVTAVHYTRMRAGQRTRGHIYIFSFLTHKEYDNRKNWDRRPG